MMELDARGLACPAPVLLVRDTHENKRPKEISVVVDNEAATQNVSRFLGTRGFESSIKKEGEDFLIIGKIDMGVMDDSAKFQKTDNEMKRIMVMVATDRIGYGDEELGKKLMASFLGTLREMGDELWRVVFVNNGVKMTVMGSDVLSDLKELESQGTHILVCGTCLNHFDLTDKKEVGETTNMLDIVTSMQLADQVINI